MTIDKVIKDGKIIVEKGKLIYPVKTKIQPPRNSINIKKITRNTFSVKDTGKKVRVIKLLPEQIITKQIMARLKSENGELLPDIENDIIKLSVVERHHGTGNSCTSFVKGFEIKEGAICSTVAHDSHNLIILGTNNDDMMFCVKIIAKMGGGLVVVKDGKLMASLALPFGGIMSENTLVEVRRDYNKVVQAAKNLGCKISDPFMTLSFLALPVIPDIKITDRGLVDVNSFDFISLYQEGES
jgi:adenine deaminase